MVIKLKYKNSPEQDKEAFLKVGSPADWLFFVEHPEERFRYNDGFCLVCTAFGYNYNFGDYELSRMEACGKCMGDPYECLKHRDAKDRVLRKRLERAGVIKPVVRTENLFGSNCGAPCEEFGGCTICVDPCEVQGSH